MIDNKDLIKNLKELGKLEAGGRPQAAWLLSNKEILMSQINPRGLASRQETREFDYYRQYFIGLFQQRILQPVGTLCLLVAVLVTYTATFNVANASLPGDTLYPVKTASEKVQLAFAFNDQEKVKLQINFVSRRADELQQIVVKNDSKVVKKEKIIKAAQKISEENKVLKDKINKIKAASAGSEVIEMAKEVDVKSLSIKENISLAQNSLPSDVKKDVDQDVKQAIISTEEVGNSALAVIVANHKNGESQISDEEVASRVAERIKNAEEDIEVAASEISSAVSYLRTTSTSTSKLIESQTKNATSTLDKIVQTPQTAKDMIKEAKDLLVKKDFSMALEKIQQSKDLVIDLATNAKEMVKDLNNSGVSDTSSSTNLLLNDKNGQATSSSQTSESTKDLLKK